MNSPCSPNQRVQKFLVIICGTIFLCACVSTDNLGVGWKKICHCFSTFLSRNVFFSCFKQTRMNVIKDFNGIYQQFSFRNDHYGPRTMAYILFTAFATCYHQLHEKTCIIRGKKNSKRQRTYHKQCIYKQYIRVIHICGKLPVFHHKLPRVTTCYPIPK